MSTSGTASARLRRTSRYHRRAEKPKSRMCSCMRSSSSRTVVTTWAGAVAATEPGAAPARSAPMRWRARSVCQCSRAPPMPRWRHWGSTTPLIEA